MSKTIKVILSVVIVVGLYTGCREQPRQAMETDSLPEFQRQEMEQGVDDNVVNAKEETTAFVQSQLETNVGSQETALTETIQPTEGKTGEMQPAQTEPLVTEAESETTEPVDPPSGVELPEDEFD